MRIPTLFTLFAVAACATPPPPAAPQPEPAREVAPPPKAPEPPPPPKCEAFEEKCVAGVETKLAIGQASVHPPLGWTYAKEAKASVMVAPAADGVLAFATAAGDDPDAELAAVNGLLALLGVSDVKASLLKTRLKKAQSTVIADQTTVKLWEIDRENHGGVDPKKDGKAGAALVAIARLGSVTVVGVGYVPKTSPASNVAAMMDAIKSLRGDK